MKKTFPEVGGYIFSRTLDIGHSQHAKEYLFQFMGLNIVNVLNHKIIIPFYSYGYHYILSSILRWAVASLIFQFLDSLFFKTLFKGNNFAVWRVRARGVNSILITILRF